MTPPATPEITPVTVTELDNSFEKFIQKVSGHGETLEIAVNHNALREAVSDTGLGEETSVTFAFLASRRDAHINVTAGHTKRVHNTIGQNSPLLRTKEDAQRAIQTDILASLGTLAEEAGIKPIALNRKMKAPLKERLKYHAKMLGGLTVSFYASSVAVETVASASPGLIKIGSVLAVGIATLRELDEYVKPPEHTDSNVIDGYPPFIDFTVKPS